MLTIAKTKYLNTMKNRIVQLINSEGLTSSKFADTIGVQRSSVSHILSGRNNPSLDFIQKIINAFPQINTDWLIAGNGEMYKTDGAPSLFDSGESTMQLEETQPVSTNQPPKLKKDTPTSQIPQPEQVFDLNTASSPKRIEKVVVFYSDKTFKEFNPA